jgi:transcriptional regulator with XRE-family HTH domain
MTSPPEPPIPLHVQIRNARREAKLSMARLARRAGVNRSWLQKYEQHGSNITVESLLRLVGQLPQAQFVLHDGLTVAHAPESAELAALLRQFVRTSTRHATQARAAAEAVQAMTATANELAELAVQMEALWDRLSVGGGGEGVSGGSSDVGQAAADTLAGAPNDDLPEGVTSHGQPLPAETEPLPAVPAAVEEPLIRKRTLRFSNAFHRLFRPNRGNDE